MTKIKELIYPKWFYDETVQVGTDYQDISNVQAYDVEMAKFRDVKKKQQG